MDSLHTTMSNSLSTEFGMRAQRAGASTAPELLAGIDSESVRWIDRHTVSFNADLTTIRWMVENGLKSGKPTLSENYWHS